MKFMEERGHGSKGITQLRNMDVMENCSQGMWLSYEALKLGILEVREFLYSRLRKIRE